MTDSVSKRYPDNFGWHFKVSRGVLRKSPAMSAFHKFMVAETEIVSTLHLMKQVCIKLYN
jgi:hypothetical protein